MKNRILIKIANDSIRTPLVQWLREAGFHCQVDQETAIFSPVDLIILEGSLQPLHDVQTAGQWQRELQADFVLFLYTAERFNQAGHLLRNAQPMLIWPVARDWLLSRIRDILTRRVRVDPEDPARTVDSQVAGDLENLFYWSPDMICVAGLDGYFRRVNPAFKRVLGWPEEEMINQPWQSFVHPEDAAKTQEMVDLLAQGLPCSHFENRWRCREGSYKIFSWSAMAVLSEGLVHAVARDVTEQRAADDKIFELAEQLSTTQESITDAFFILDQHWTFTYVNQQCERLLDRHRSTLLGKNVWEEFHEAKGTLFYHEYHRALQEGNPVHFEEFYPPLNAWLEAHAYPSPNGLAVYFRDITGRKEAEARLLQSRQELEIILDSVPALVFYKDKNNHYIRINQAYATMEGKSKQEIEGRSLFDLYPQEHAAAYWEDDKEVMRTGLPKRGIVEPLVTPQGPRWLRSDKVPYFDEKGQIVGIIGFSLDITEQLAAEGRIQEQAALLDMARDAIMVVGFDDVVQFWNKGCERTYLWKAQEVLGTAFDPCRDDQRQKHGQARAAVLARGEWAGELRHINRLGQDITIEGRWSVVHDVSGQPKAILCIHTDVTESKLLQSQFLRAQRLESIGTLAGGIAHDLNNVLSPILMSIGLLRMITPDQEILNILDTMESSSKRGAEMIRHVLSFARGMDGNRVVVQVARLIRDIQKITTDTFPKNIGIQVESDRTLWAVSGDPTQLHQVLLNLCVNARDAMPSGGTLTITALNMVLDEGSLVRHLEAAPGHYIRVSVQDNGTGMPHEILDKIFDPFFTTKEQGKGTGLGLSTSHAIVRGHHGFFKVASELGRGSIFSVYLPAQLTAEEEQATEIEEELARGNGECVLVVDDEESIRLVLRQTLEEFGYRVLLAIDGADAIALFAQHQDQVDVVLTDIMMPVMDGVATIQVLRRLKPSVKIIAASGLSTNAQMGRALNAGVKQFLPKPYTAATLLKVLHQVLHAPEPGPENGCS